MILTCPQCATRYFLPDVQVGRAGRAVKCTNCATVWRVEPPLDEEPPPTALQPPPTISDPEEEFAGSAQRRAEILREKKAEAERKARQAAVITAAVWAGVAAAIALCLAGGIVFRIQVVRWWPGAATAYAALGMPVNASGLLIDKVQAAPAIVGGRRALVVTGLLINVSAGLRPAPAFKVTVLDKAARAILQKVINVPAVALKVGETRRFQLQVIDPPGGANDVEVTLAPPSGVPTPAIARAPAPPTAAAPPAAKAALLAKP